MVSPDRTLPQLAVRLLIWTFLLLTAIFGLELAFDLWRSGTTFAELQLSPRQVQALASTVSRAFNNLMTMVLAFIALAIPITANMYTPKLIEIFVSDRVNIAALLFFAIMGAHGIFAQAMAFEQWAPVLQFGIAWTSGVLGFALLIPYYLYVLSFLDPDRIIQRVTRRITAEYGPIARQERPMEAARRRLNNRILHLGNVILRAIDRSDRDVSLSSIAALRRAVELYLDTKPGLPPAWFEIDARLFVGLSEEALELLARDRTWVEHRCLSQLLLAYQAALAHMQDAISAISDVNRAVALHARARGDVHALELCVRFFNTYLRSAVRKRDVHAIYDVFYQYKLLARDLLASHPSVALSIARYFKYYADFARHEKVPFVYELAASDLSSVVECAYGVQSPARREILDIFLAFDAEDTTLRMTSARALLAGYLLDAGCAEEAALVADRLYASDPAQVRRARRNILETTEPAFWEVTDRQRNLDFVEPKHRETVARLLADILAKRREEP